MSGWHRGPLCGYDLETTAPNPEEARIVTACVVEIDGTGKFPPEARNWLAKPAVPIPDEAAAIHGITTEKAEADGAEPALVVAEVLAELHTALEAGVPVVAFNAPYDFTVLDRECRRYDLPTLDKLLGRPIAPVIDPYVLDKHLDKYRRGSRTLTATCEHYKVRLDGAHDASFDAVAACRVAWRIAENNPRIGGMDLGVLHGLQVQAKAEQADGFREYLRKQRKPCDDVRGEWPLIPFEGQAAIA